MLTERPFQLTVDTPIVNMKGVVERRSLRAPTHVEHCATCGAVDWALVVETTFEYFADEYTLAKIRAHHEPTAANVAAKRRALEALRLLRSGPDLHAGCFGVIERHRLSEGQRERIARSRAEQRGVEARVAWQLRSKMDSFDEVLYRNSLRGVS